MSKTIEIKKIHLRNLFLSFILGFTILFGLEHFGKFSFKLENVPYNGKPTFEQQVPLTTKLSMIKYYTFFDNAVETSGNGFDAYDVNYLNTDFDKYSVKSYYYTQATIKDYKYGIYISSGLFILSLFFSTFKIKIS